MSETPYRQHTVVLTGDKAMGEVFFSQVIKEAAVIFALVDEGTLRMASIGFLPEKIRRLDKDELRVEQGSKTDPDVLTIGGGGQVDIVESLLLEWSITATGADTGAFKQALSRGDVGGEKLSASLKTVFQKIAGPDSTWSPGWTPESKTEPTDTEIQQAVEQLPDRVAQKIESCVDAFVSSLDEKIDKRLRQASGVLD